MRRTLAVTAAVLALIAATAAVTHHAIRTGGTGAGGAPNAVDIGFAQDMIVHHQQAVLMAAYTQRHAGSDEVRVLASAIGSAQQREIGQMVGWLQSWGMPEQTDRPPMVWMGSGMSHDAHLDHGGRSMPGMATPAELDKLVNLTGRELDDQFLGLMIRHHEGGLLMAKYAATRAHMAYVRGAARMMIQDQQREVDLMQTLR